MSGLTKKDEERKKSATSHLGGIGAVLTGKKVSVEDRFSPEHRAKAEQVGEAPSEGPEVDEAKASIDGSDVAKKTARKPQTKEVEAAERGKEDVWKRTSFSLPVEGVIKYLNYYKSLTGREMNPRVVAVLEKEVKQIMKEFRKEFGEDYIAENFKFYEEHIWPELRDGRARKNR